MAIKPCRECGKDISSEARTCPHCGVKRPARRQTPFGVLVLIAVAVVGLMALMSRESQAPPVPADHAASAAHPAAPQAAASGMSPQDSARTFLAMAEAAVKANLRDPESARFGPVVVYRSRPGLEAACGTVNAKNGFGGYAGDTPFISRGTAAATMVLSADNATLFRRAYRKLCAGKVLASLP